MSLFTNQNLVPRICRHYGIQKQLDPTVARIVQALVESMTRRLLQQAIKFMTHGRRQQLSIEDLQSSLQSLGISSMRLLPTDDDVFKQTDSGSIRKDPIFKDVEELIKNELKGLNHQFKLPAIRGRWIYINGKVPKTSANAHIKDMREIMELKHKVEEQRSRKFNLIRVRPMSLYTIQEEEFFRKITVDLEQGKMPALPKSNLTTLFPMLVSYVLSVKVADHMLLFLLELLGNRYVQKSLEIHLHQMIVYLMGYEGKWAWDAGWALAQLVIRWKKRYPKLEGIYHVQDLSYCIRIKKLAYILAGGDIPLSTCQTLDKDIYKKVFMADEYAYLLRKCKKAIWKLSSSVAKSQLPFEESAQGLAGLESDAFLDLCL